jgi:hypothetical protein
MPHLLMAKYTAPVRAQIHARTANPRFIIPSQSHSFNRWCRKREKGPDRTTRSKLIFRKLLHHHKCLAVARRFLAEKSRYIADNNLRHLNCRKADLRRGRDREHRMSPTNSMSASGNDVPRKLKRNASYRATAKPIGAMANLMCAPTSSPVAGLPPMGS